MLEMMIRLPYSVSSISLSAMLEADTLCDISRLGDKLLLFKRFSLSPPVTWLLIAESVAQRKTPMLDWRPVMHAGLLVTETCRIQGGETTVLLRRYVLVASGKKGGFGIV